MFSISFSFSPSSTPLLTRRMLVIFLHFYFNFYSLLCIHTQTYTILHFNNFNSYQSDSDLNFLIFLLTVLIVIRVCPFPPFLYAYQFKQSFDNYNNKHLPLPLFPAVAEAHARHCRKKNSFSFLTLSKQIIN